MEVDIASTETSRHSIRVETESLTKYRRTGQLIPYFMLGLNGEIM